MFSLHIFLLSIIQGLTEFLPVSSSGHLILFAKYTNFGDQGQSIDIALHIGSLIAVVYYFWKTIKGMIVDLFRHKFAFDTKFENIRLAYYLVFATLPAIVIGATLSYIGMDWVRTAKLIGWTLIFYSLLLWVADTKFSTKKNLSDMKLWEALTIGFVQCLAFIPGTSRSGVTITAGRFLGFNRSEIAKFSMLLSIPSILAAGILTAYNIYKHGDMGQIALAYQAIGWSFIFSFLAIFLMMKWLRFATFLPFVIYRVVLGIMLLVHAYGLFN